MLHAKTPVHHRGTITTPASCTIRSISRTFHGPASSVTAQRGIVFYVAEILDPANFKSSYGSSEKDADREPAAAAGHLVSSLSTHVYIHGAIPKISVRCKHTSIF